MGACAMWCRESNTQERDPTSKGLACLRLRLKQRNYTAAISLLLFVRADPGRRATTFLTPGAKDRPEGPVCYTMCIPSPMSYCETHDQFNCKEPHGPMGGAVCDWCGETPLFCDGLCQSCWSKSENTGEGPGGALCTSCRREYVYAEGRCYICYTFRPR